MAHNAALSELISELVASVTKLDSSVSCSPNEYKQNTDQAKGRAREFRKCRDHALRQAKSHQYARANQFEVDKILSGLLEKFQILDREDLARALDVRLQKLKARPSKWTPDILSLLLQLSDNPLAKTNIGGLNLLKAPESSVQLTWDDIIADDPLDEEGVWDDIDYAARGSSDDDSFVLDDEASLDDTPTTSPFTDNVAQAARSYIIQPQPAALQQLKGSQQRLQNALDETSHAGPDEDAITELMLSRESIMMLRGLPSTLFSFNSTTGQCVLQSNVKLVQTSVTSMKAILHHLAQTATQLRSLRLWTNGVQTIPVLQTLQATVRDRLHVFDTHLTDLELEHIMEKGDAVVSLANVLHSTKDTSTTLLELNQLISQLTPQAAYYQSLELLHDRLCLAQLAGEIKTFADLASVFFKCLETYLRPVRKWMRQGELSPDNPGFFVVELSGNHKLESAWHDRFALSCLADGGVDAPTFLHALCKRILNAGKSVKLLEDLGELTDEVILAEPVLSFNTVCGGDATLVLPPFAELLSDALNAWVANHHTYSSSMVCTRILQDYGLWRSLDSLEYIYFARDGSRMQLLADATSEKFARGSRSWNDRFFLTDLMQNIFADVPAIDTDCISIAVARGKTRLSKLQKLACINVTYKVRSLDMPLSNFPLTSLDSLVDQ